MKKKIILSVLAVCSLFIVVGCGNSNSKYEKVFKEYATTYYNAHQKGSVNLTDPTVTIKDLKDSVASKTDSFDMSKLDKCKDDSIAKIEVDANREIKNITFTLNCGK